MRCIVLGAVGLVGFYLLAQPLIRNQVVVPSDLGRAHLPSRDFYQKCLAAGDEYFWCPGQFCGYFIHGEGQGGYDHPLHRALYSWLPLAVAFNLEVFLNYPFLLAGMYLFLRRHDLSREAALFGGLSFTFSGFALSHYPHTNAIVIVSHIPWLLWAIDIAWRAEPPRTRSYANAVVAMLTGSQILLGYPQYSWFSAVAEGLYVIALLRQDGAWGRLFSFVAAKMLGLMVGAAQLLPSLEALRDSPRMGYSNEFRGTFSLHPGHLLQLVAPALFNERTQLHEFAVYMGAIASIALLWWVIRPRIAGVLGVWVTAMTVLAVPCALGKYTPVFHVYLKLPIVGVFRGPCRYLVLVHLAAAVGIALLVQHLQRIERPIAWRRLAWLLTVPLIAWILVRSGVDWLGSEMTPFTEKLSGEQFWQPIRSVVVLGTATGLFIAAARRWRGALTLLMALGIADQIDFGMRSIRLYPTVPLASLQAQEFAPPTPTSERVEMEDVHGNTLMMFGVRLTSGYVGLTPPRVLDYTVRETQAVCGTSWWHRNEEWIKIDEALPRVRLVTQAKRSDDPRRDLSTIDPANVVLVDRDLELPAGAPGVAEMVSDRPGWMRVKCRSDTKQVLIFAESFHRAWSANLDGQPVEILRAYGDFQACIVPAGDHEVECRFIPLSVVWGRCWSWIGLGLTVFAAMRGRWAGMAVR